jgi:hypothetical protein
MALRAWLLPASFPTSAKFQRALLRRHVRFGPKADMAISCAGFFADPNTAPLTIE